MSIEKALAQIRNELPEGVKLVAVSKFQSKESILEAYRAGQRVFGESRALELREKHEALPGDIEWHFIGTMQTNKVKYYAPFVSLIQSVDSLRALQAIQKEALKNNRTIDVLLEVHIAGEQSKQGFLPSEPETFWKADFFDGYPNVRIRGLMGMATFTEDKERVRREFETLKSLFDRLKNRLPAALGGVFDTLSMGMTDDWRQAVESGSTMVRIGSYIFGARTEPEK